MRVNFFSSFLENEIVQGRVIANKSFLNALFKDVTDVSLCFFLGSEFERQNFFNVYGRWRNRFEVLSREDAIGANWHKTIIHQPDLAWDEVLYLRENIFRGNVPISCFTHSISYPSLLRRFVSALKYLRRTDRIICSSPTAKTVIKAIGEVVKVEFSDDILEVIPLGIPIGCMDAITKCVDVSSFRKELSLDEKVLFLCFGRISEFSKADLFGLLKICFRIARKRRNFMVIIAGATDESNYAEYIRSIVKIWGIEDVVKVICDPDEEEKHVLFSISDVFIALSDNFQETFGQVLLEAMAYNLPIIATDWGGFRDVLAAYPNWMKVETFCFDGIEEVLSVYEKISYEMILHLYWASCVWFDFEQVERYMLSYIDNGRKTERCVNMERICISEKWDWGSIINKYVTCWQRMLEDENEYLFENENPADVRGKISSVFFRLYPSHRLSYKDAFWCRMMDRDLVRKGLGLHSELSNRLDSLRIKSFLEETDGSILLEDLVRSVGMWEASWMLKQGWVQIG